MNVEQSPQPHYSPLWQLTLARLREFYRVPEAVFWVYGFPLLMALALGIAFRSEPVEEIHIDLQRGSATDNTSLEALQKELVKEKRFKIKILNKDAAQRRLQRGKTDVIVVLRNPKNGRPTYEYWFEPNRSESMLGRHAIDAALARIAAPEKAPDVTEKTIEVPGSRYIDFLIPGLIGMNLMSGGLWGLGFVTVDLRVRKMLKRLLATPMRKHDYLLSLMLSRLMFMVPEVLLLLVFGYFVFGIQIAGNILFLVGVMVLGAVAFAGMGLLVASRAKTIETISGLINLVMLPMFVLSGVFFSSDRFPAFMQPFIQVLPLTAMNDALRGIMLDGAGPMTIGLELLNLTLWGAVSFVVALWIFRWG